MKSKTFICYFNIAVFLMTFVIPMNSNALNYNIAFTGTGASNTVESVIVHNLTKGTTVVVPAGNTLNLYDVVSDVEKLNGIIEHIRIYPNPIKNQSALSFYAPYAGGCQINILGIDGRNLAALSSILEPGENEFQLSLPQGVFILRVNGNGYNYTKRVICHSNSHIKPNVSFIGNQQQRYSPTKKVKNGIIVTPMLYSTGDQLLYKGVSGNYKTIVTDVPTESKTTNFEFVECKDADNNYYPIVKIGDQVWMAENYKYLPIISNPSETSFTEPNYYVYNHYGNDINVAKSSENYNTYGVLYNWKAALQSSPTGWHLPSDYEWGILNDYLTNNGYGYIYNSSIGKSMAANILWENTSCYGGELPSIGQESYKNNKSGFSLLPGGYIYNSNFYGVTSDVVLQGATESSQDYGFPISLMNCGGGIGRGGFDKQTGLSVRYILNLETDTLPRVASTEVIDLKNTTVTFISELISDGGTGINQRGFCWSTTPNPTIENNVSKFENYESKAFVRYGIGQFFDNITNLNMNTTYYVRSYATNYKGTTYGSETSFTTSEVPLLTTNTITSQSETVILSGGLVSDIGNSNIIQRGLCWSTTHLPTIADNKTEEGQGNGSFSSTIDNLPLGKTYRVRAYATNGSGTGYGNEVLFSNDKFTDSRDGNTYKIITIGNQTWMAENLKATTFRNGDNISNVTNTTDWFNANYPARCFQSNSQSYGDLYGLLYNWYVVGDARNIAPEGWHVPTVEEWKLLQNYLIANGYNYDKTSLGNKIANALASNTLWHPSYFTSYGTPGNDVTSNNSSGFSALPSGIRNHVGDFVFFGEYCYFWSLPETNTTVAQGFSISSSNNCPGFGGNLKGCGFSIRLIRD